MAHPGRAPGPAGRPGLPRPHAVRAASAGRRPDAEERPPGVRVRLPRGKPRHSADESARRDCPEGRGGRRALMTDGKPTPVAPSSGPIAREIAEWLRDIRKGWTNSLDRSTSHIDPHGDPHRGPLSRPLRWGYAASGSLTWLVGFTVVRVSMDTRFVNFILSDSIFGATFLMLGGLVISAWFGWLISFVDRKCGPLRLFLDGLLLPTAAMTLIGLSVGRIQSIGEPRASSQSRELSQSRESSQLPITLPEQPQESSEPAQVTGGAEEPGGR